MLRPGCREGIDFIHQELIGLWLAMETVLHILILLYLDFVCGISRYCGSLASVRGSYVYFLSHL